MTCYWGLCSIHHHNYYKTCNMNLGQMVMRNLPQYSVLRFGPLCHIHFHNIVMPSQKRGRLHRWYIFLGAFDKGRKFDHLFPIAAGMISLNLPWILSAFHIAFTTHQGILHYRLHIVSGIKSHMVRHCHIRKASEQCKLLIL